MSTVKVSNDSITITSKVPFSLLKRVQQFAPAALTLRVSDNGTTREVFRATLSEDTGSYGDISSNSVKLVQGLNDTANISLRLPSLSGGEAIKSAIAEQYGSALSLLNQLEDSILAASEAIEKQQASIIDSIVIE